jgi:phage regulator Rha-like protein
MNNLVILKRQKLEEVPVTTSKIIADQCKLEHHTVTKLIQTHEKRLEKFGILRFKIEEIDGRGQPEKYYELNEMQSTLLVTFMKNTEIVADFKVELVRQFYQMRQLILQKSTQEWQEARTSGKLFQKQLNDTIKEFVAYAQAQGSKHAPMYYTHFARLSNNVVGIEDGKRDIAQARQITIQSIIIDIIKSTIEESMLASMPYKGVFELCKERVSIFKNNVPMLKMA